MTPAIELSERTVPRPGHATAKPKLGFVGVGWIGLNRLEAIVKSGLAEVVAIADPSREMTARAGAIAPRAVLKKSLDELWAPGLDGVVIATPSALHAEQAAFALNRGVAVFCQKPLGRDAHETRAVIQAARQADRLLGVDLSYRQLSAAQRIREVIRRGELGRIFAVEAVFHNAYGPDKPWFYNRKLSGGGCVVDLGIHLVDLALWCLGFPRVIHATSRMLFQGEPWQRQPDSVEDYATARLDLETGAVLQLSCSWKLPAGRPAAIRLAIYGTGGGVALENLNGSFYDFVGERFQGTSREVLTSGVEDWGGRATVAWAERLARDRTFDPEIESLVQVAGVLDQIYQQNLH
jgi:predicted dehydrogenase